MREKENNKIELPGGWELNIAQSREEIEAIRPVWEKMQNLENCPTIDADIDRYLAVIDTKKDSTKPYVIVLSNNCEPAAMVIGKIGTLPVDIKFGYKTFFKPKLKCLIVTYGGVLGQLDDDTESMLVRELIKMSKRRYFDMIYFNHLKVDTNVFRLVQKLPGFLCRDYVPVLDIHWQTNVPESKDDFNKSLSRNERRNIKRHVKQLEEKASGSVELKTYRGLENLDEYISIASRISSLTYQNMITGGFSDTETIRSLVTDAATKDLFRGYILYAGSEPVAFESGLIYKSTYFAEYRGYHPDWTCGSPGSILLLKVLEECSDDSGIRRYDYGFGDAPYKQRYGHEKWDEAPIYIFSPRAYPVFINIVRTCFASLEISVKKILKKSGVIDKVKRSWRKRLEQKAIKKNKTQPST